METVKLAITGMTCGHCVSSVRTALESVPGVQVEHVGIGSAELRLNTLGVPAATSSVLAAVQDAGYEPSVEASTGSAEAASTPTGCSCCAPSAPAPRSRTASRSA